MVREQLVMEMMDLMLVMNNQFTHLFHAGVEFQEKCMVIQQLIKEDNMVRDQYVMEMN